MLIDIKMKKKICNGIRSQWRLKIYVDPKKKLLRPWHLSPFLQNG